MIFAILRLQKLDYKFFNFYIDKYNSLRYHDSTRSWFYAESDLKLPRLRYETENYISTL